MSISEVRAFYGDSFTASYVVSNTTYTTIFQYLGSGSLSSGVTGANLAENGVADSIADFANYHYVMYQAVFDHYYNDHSIGTMTIDALGTYYPDYVRAGIACSCLFSGHSWNPFLTSSDNSRTEWANNKWGIYQALSANPSADSNLVNYYGAFIFDGNFYRLCAAEGDTGLYLAPLQFQNIFLYSFGGQWIANIMILCPWVDADPVHDPSQTTTITTTMTENAQLPPITVNVDVDMGPVVSGLDGIAGQVAQAKEDVQGIATDISAIGSLLAVDEQQTQSVLYLDPIDTLPTLDYHKVIDDVDGVLEDIPAAVAGTASIWGIISAFFTSDSVWLWLVPLCIFLCLASFVLWRR